jgi:hypothetical protein
VVPDLGPASTLQPALLNPVWDWERKARLMAAMDSINRDRGRETVRFLTTGIERTWTMRTAYRSSRYAARWEELRRAGG